MGQRITQVDAFTDRPYAGNPAAVAILERPREEVWMRDVAREMNLAETAFLAPAERGAGNGWPGVSGAPEPGDYLLRWFTPAAEVDLCGHATLAAAHVLFEEGRVGPERPARFHSKSGLLVATREAAGAAAGAGPAWITLDFPATPPVATPAPAGLLQALRLDEVGAVARYVGRSRFDYLVEIEGGEEAVRALGPDFGALLRVEARGVIVTAPAGGPAAETSRGAVAPAYDFVSRFFAPRVGVNEDPVTGSAHCALAPYWAGRLGKTEMLGRQVSARDGFVRVNLPGGPAGERVRLGGRAITVLRGELLAE